jgi:hypothetical protein
VAGPVDTAVTQLVNLGVTTFTQLIDGKPDITFPAMTPMTAIPQGTTPDQMRGWKNRSINIPWRTVWGVKGLWGSNCQLRLHFSYDGQWVNPTNLGLHRDTGQGRYLSNIFLTRGDPWNPSRYSNMKISINPGQPANSATPDFQIPYFPITISVHEHMDVWWLTGSLQEDYTFYLYGDGRWNRA